MEPINYLAQIPQQDIGKSLLEGLKLGAGIRDIQVQQQAQERAQKLQDVADARQLAFKSDWSNFTANPTIANVKAIQMKYPEFNDYYKNVFESMNKEQAKSELGGIKHAYASLKNNDINTAYNILEERAVAMENSKLDTSGIRSLQNQIVQDPQNAKAQTLMALSGFMEPKDFKEFTDALHAEELQPSALTKAEAGAKQAVSEAKIKEGELKNQPQAQADVHATALSENERRKAQTQIELLNAQISRETNDLKRQELGLQRYQLNNKIQDDNNSKISELTSAKNTAEDTLTTIARLKKNKSLPSIIGSIAGSDYNPVLLLSDEARDADALIQNLKSQTFMVGIKNMVGMGALSNAEGEKVGSAVQNLDKKQSIGQFNKNLDTIALITKRGYENQKKKYARVINQQSLPPIPATVPASDIDAILAKHGVK